MTNEVLSISTAGVETTPAPLRGRVVRSRWLYSILTFLTVFGPGLIVMEAANDAGAVSTYVQAGAQYGTRLLWILLLLLPVTYFIQEMVVRRAARLVFRDRFCWRGPWDEAKAGWHFGTGPACGSLFVTGSIEDNTGAARFATAAGDTCFRWCGESEAVVAGVVETALRAAGEKSGGAWLTQPDLAPNHWFRMLNGDNRGLSISHLYEDRRFG